MGWKLQSLSKNHTRCNLTALWWKGGRKGLNKLRELSWSCKGSRKVYLIMY